MSFDGNERNPCQNVIQRCGCRTYRNSLKTLKCDLLSTLFLSLAIPSSLAQGIVLREWSIVGGWIGNHCPRRQSLPSTCSTKKSKNKKKNFLASTIDWLDCKQSRLNSTSSGGRTNSPFHPIFLADCGFIKVDSMGRVFNKRRITSYLCPDRFFLHFLSNIMS